MTFGFDQCVDANADQDPYFGCLGVTLKRNIMNAWWKAFVEDRDDMYGVDAAILMNKKVWEAGIKGVPFRLRVRISRKRNDEEGAKEKLYSYVQAVNVKVPKGLQTLLVEDA